MHQRFHCPALQLQRRQTISANLVTYLLRVGEYFWFEPCLRCAYTHQGKHQAAHDRKRQSTTEGVSQRTPQSLQHENPGGLLEIYTETTTLARRVAVLTDN